MSFRDMHNFKPPILPALCKLFLSLRRPIPALDLPSLAPNLHTLHVHISNASFNDRVGPWAGPSLPSLRSVAFGSVESVRSAENLLNTAHHLRISRLVPCDDPDNEDQARRITTMLQALRKTSPVRAQLFVETGDRPMEFWREVREVAPRLRYLELRVKAAKIDVACASWLENVPGALSSLSLLGLRLHLLMIPEAVARSLYSAQMEGLPQRFADAIRSLRVVAIAGEEPCEDYDANFRMSSMSVQGVDDRREDCDDYEYKYLWYMPTVKTLEWWRIIRDDAGTVRQLDMLTVDEGRRVRRFFENSDAEAIEHIDDFLLGL